MKNNGKLDFGIAFILKILSGVLLMRTCKILLSSATALALSLAVGNSTQVNAATAENVDMIENTINENHEIVPLINWSGNAYLTKNKWSNVIGSNNIFRDSPTITNRAGNPGTVKFRIVNSKGNIIAESGYIASGKSVKLGPIPASAGTYTIQGNAEVTGTYNIAVD